MASIQDLLAAAARPRKSPFIGLLEGVAAGFGRAQAAAPEQTRLLMLMDKERAAADRERLAAEQDRADRERAAESSRQAMAMLGEQQEQKTQDALGAAGAPKKSPHPGTRLARLKNDKYGYPQVDIEFIEPKTPLYQAKEYRDPQGRTRLGRFNPETGKLEQGADDAFAPQAARGETASNLRKEFIDRPEVKEFVAVSTQVRSMDALLNSALAGNQKNQLALDQGIITMYNKLLDPTSVVRESEYARTPENLPMVNRITGAIAKVQDGGAGLTNDDREALVLGAKLIANERGAVFSQRRGEYGTLAKKMEIDPALVTDTIADFKPYELTPRRGGAPAPGSPAAPGGAPIQVGNFRVRVKG